MSATLFDPITLRGVTARNRIWVPPMCQYSADARDGMPTEWHHVHLGALARGGAGAVIVEATAVVPEGRISPEDLGLWNDDQRDALRPIVDFMHDQGALAGIQLAHAGRKGSTYKPWAEQRGTVPAADGGWEAFAPSAVAFDGYATPTAMTREGIREVVDAFAASARRAVDAGFDLLELHAAHGYLLHEFLSPLSNERTDAYGGSLEHRARIVLEVVDAVRAEVGEEVPLLMRFSATDWTEGGWSPEEMEQVTRWVVERGIDLVDVSSGGNVHARIPLGPGYQVPFASGLRTATGVPTAAVGLIDDARQAADVVASGAADVVLVGRESLRDPNFPLRAARELGVAVDYTPRAYERAYR
ncbi:NADH:flavin oxidoreductase/NADH oxidase [Agromyces sp. SYSU T00194]|uniref:NADH:flavin oxidoreductase/NADH oxidase n=1 Tax=Agromyces chitinivorans TaxID=3158560 RepID=UPI0033928BA0